MRVAKRLPISWASWGVIFLHQAPVIALPEYLAYRAQARGVAIQPSVQFIGCEAVGECLRPLYVSHTHERVVGGGEIDTGVRELSRKPRMAVAVKLQPKRTPRRYPQVTQAQRLINEVEVVVQALARVGSQVGLAAGLVVPGLVGFAGLHRRDNVHQPWMPAARRQHLGHHVFLADMRLGNVLDPCPLLGCQLLRAFPNPIAQRLGKARVVEDPNPIGVQKARHARRVADPRQRTRNHNPVVAGQHSMQAPLISLRQHPHHRCLRPPACTPATLSSLVPALPA